MWCLHWLTIPTPAARKVSDNGNAAGNVDAAGRRSDHENVTKANDVLDNFGNHSSGSAADEDRSRVKKKQVGMKPKEEKEHVVEAKEKKAPNSLAKAMIKLPYISAQNEV